MNPRERAKRITERFFGLPPGKLYPLIEQFAPPHVMDEVRQMLEDAIVEEIEAAVREAAK